MLDQYILTEAGHREPSVGCVGVCGRGDVFSLSCPMFPKPLSIIFTTCFHARGNVYLIGEVESRRIWDCRALPSSFLLLTQWSAREGAPLFCLPSHPFYRGRYASGRKPCPVPALRPRGRTSGVLLASGYKPHSLTVILLVMYFGLKTALLLGLIFWLVQWGRRILLIGPSQRPTHRS